MEFEELAKENEGKTAGDEEFARAIGLSFYVDGTAETITIGGETQPATAGEICLWSQLRHAYGFEPYGTVNSLHLAQIDREEEARGCKIIRV